MIIRSQCFAWLVSLSAAIALAGCSNSASESSTPATAHDDHEHEHAEEGPHGGHLINLGEEEYHAELTHDDATHRVAIYLLDGSAAEPVSIDAREVSINLVSNGAPMQFMLPAKAQASDPEGKASQFEIISETLCDAWDAPNTRGRLTLSIEGKPYVGTIEAHEHEHH